MGISDMNTGWSMTRMHAMGSLETCLCNGVSRDMPMLLKGASFRDLVNDIKAGGPPIVRQIDQKNHSYESQGIFLLIISIKDVGRNSKTGQQIDKQATSLTNNQHN